MIPIQRGLRGAEGAEEAPEVRAAKAARPAVPVARAQLAVRREAPAVRPVAAGVRRPTVETSFAVARRAPRSWPAERAFPPAARCKTPAVSRSAAAQSASR